MRLPTPLTDEVVLPGAPTGPAAHPASAVAELRGLLGNWGSLTVRMAAGWPPSAWYPARMYEEDLHFRDELDAHGAELADPCREKARRALATMDAWYEELTVDDGGAGLAAGVEAETDRTVRDLTRRPWYWRRRPERPPWRT